MDAALLSSRWMRSVLSVSLLLPVLSVSLLLLEQRGRILFLPGLGFNMDRIIGMIEGREWNLSVRTPSCLGLSKNTQHNSLADSTKAHEEKNELDYRPKKKIKEDVETQGEFVKSLIKEVTDAAYKDIEDVVAFVKWLDDELGFLVDERAVLKHFDWPERKADTLREAAFGYQDLKKLESEVSNYKDDPRLPCDIALKKMVTLSEKTERGVYNLLRTRDAMMRQGKEFNIPTDWMLDNNLISKIKFASVKLANMYMKRVAMELEYMGPLNKDPALEYMLLQAVRFAFRIHQFAGGFDAETMDAFEELRNLVHVRNNTK